MVEQNSAGVRTNDRGVTECVNAPTSRSHLADCITAFTCWYLSAILVAMGFSLGFYLLKRPLTDATVRNDLIGATIMSDGIWYHQIISRGYFYNPAVRSNVAYFPVFPLLGFGVRALTGLRPEEALLIVANIGFLFALMLLAKYTRARFPDGPSDLTDYTLAAAALVPTGCFFRLPFSESTFLVLAILAMLAMVRSWPLWLVTLIVGLATGARPVGVALLAPLAIHVWRRGGAPRRRLAVFAVYLPLGCWGIAAYMLYQYAAFGEPLAFAKTQRYWAIWPEAPLAQRLVALANFTPVRSVYDPNSAAFWAGFDVHAIPWFSLNFANPIFMGGAAMLALVGAWRGWLNLEETCLCAGLILIPYLTRGYEMSMASSGRFAAVAFPTYLVIAHFLRQLPTAISCSVLSLSGFMLAAYAAMYAAGYLIF